MTRPISPRCTQLLSEQKAASDLVIAGMQTSLDALATDLAATKATLATATQTITDRDATIATQRTQIGDLEIQHAADLATIEEDDETIAALQARVKELEDELDPPPVEGKTRFGWFAGPSKFPNTNPTETKADMRARVAAVMGCQPPVERIFNEGTFAVPAAGVPAVISFTQDPVAWARGDFDAQLIWFVQELNVDTQYWLVPNHECDQTTRGYTALQFVAGAKHFSDVVRSVGKANVKVATILMSWTLTQGSADHWRDWYPGPDYVDALGWDAYWRPSIPHTAEDIYGKAWAVTQAEGKEFLICETSIGAQGHGGQMQDGSPIPEDVRTQFVVDAIAYLDGKAAAVTWFETNKTDGNWLLEGHPDALALWSAAAKRSVSP